MIGFIFVKIVAIFGLLLIFGLPLFVCWALVLGVTDPDEGWLRKGPARYVWWGTVGVTTVMGYIVFAAWAWPFGIPRGITSHQHLTGTLWHTVTDNMEEYDKRFADDPVITRTEDGSEIRRFILVTWNPPKRFYVTLKDVETGQVYESQYVSKHCNAHHKLVKGDQYNLQVRYFRLSDNPEKRLMEFTNLSSEFCGS